jgi:uncharacterized membrane protein
MTYERFWEVDAARGLAVMGMASYHFVFDLWWWDIWEIDVMGGGWRIWARLVASLFLILVGVSLELQFQRLNLKPSDQKVEWAIFGKKAAGIGFWALLITVVTGLLYPQEMVIFGVLHLIALTVVAAPFFLRLASPVVFGLMMLSWSLTPLVSQLQPPHSWYLWLGLAPRSFQSLDYFPVLPWIGVVLLGVLVGRQGYHQYQRRSALPEKVPNYLVRILVATGRHSLAIYLLHQPIFFGLFWLGQSWLN